jgi:IK cytokine
MAYVMELEEEAESDIPTTTIRSKKDVALSDQKATLSTNDIVINKLTQILSYLRAGSRTKKKKKVRRQR